MTGVPVVGGSTIAPGAFTRAIAQRAPMSTFGRSRTRPVAQLISAVELPPHDPRLPAWLGDAPWPPAAGALQATLRFITGIADGRAALAAARRAGPAEWKLGFQALRETKAAGQSVIHRA